MTWCCAVEYFQYVKYKPGGVRELSWKQFQKLVRKWGRERPVTQRTPGTKCSGSGGRGGQSTYKEGSISDFKKE